MKKLNLEKCESLADVFSAAIGGRPESFKEIKEFMEKSPLNQLVYATDIDRIINYDGFFADEVIDAVYALLPVKLQIAPNRVWIMTPQAFRKLNAQQITKTASHFISISLTQALSMYVLNFENKIKQVINAVKEASEHSKDIKNENIKSSPSSQKKECPISVEKNKKVKKRQKFIMSPTDERYPKWAKIVARLQEIKELRALKTTPEEERKRLKKEANCLQTAKFRLEHPDAWKKSYKKMSDLSPEKQAKRRVGNNRRNETFREIHREELRVYHNKRREQEKAENPEAVKEKDKKHNSSVEAKAAKKRYYEKNTQQVIERACRYNKIKRFKQKTGPTILSLLQGIINSKIK